MNESLIAGRLEDKVKEAIGLMREYEPIAISYSPDGYYVGISGGKDSLVITQLAIMAKIKCDFHFNNTSIEAPETYQFLKREKARLEGLGYKFIEERQYKNEKVVTMASCIKSCGLPTLRCRHCCAQLKEYGGHGKVVITGVRWEESAKRRKNRTERELWWDAKIQGETKSERAARLEKEEALLDDLVKESSVMLNNDNSEARKQIDMCLKKAKIVINPILKWTEKDIWQFIRDNKLDYNKLYDLGAKRVGCIGCCMQSFEKRRKELEEKYPLYGERVYKRCARIYYEKRINNGKPDGKKMLELFPDFEDYWGWWLGKGRPKNYEDLVEIF